MPSKSLALCYQALQDRFLDTRVAYEDAHPGHYVYIDCTYRSPTEQQMLFEVGRYLVGGIWRIDEDTDTRILTNCDGTKVRSKHNAEPALAVDFHISIGGKLTWALRHYRDFGQIAKSYGLIWGGDFSFVDGVHVELP